LYASPDIVSDQIKEDEMRGTCSKHGRDEKYVQNLGLKTCRQETSLKT